MKRLNFGLILAWGLLSTSWSTASKDSTPPMIDVKTLAPGILVEMRYATPNNFTGKVLYPDIHQCLLCEPAAHRLARVQKKLETQGLGLKIWDCYRPLSVQKKLWDVVPDANYVANPATGSKHNRGASIDLTLVDKKGQELPMPTEFDEFSEKAHRNYMNLPENIIRNRQLLESVMQAEGFIGIPKEWWHFDDPEWMKYSLRNEPLGDSALLSDTSNPILSFKLNSNCHQLVLVTAPEWKSTTGKLTLFSKNSGSWIEDAHWDVNLGRNGMKWGRGEQPNEALVQLKQESDHATPAGIFKIGVGYGQIDFKTQHQWPFQKIDSTWRCVDDPASKHYNHVLSTQSVNKEDWKSAELMDRKDHLYKWVINIEQNFPEVQAPCGSCIFFHVWRKPGAPTEGCISMDEEKMVFLLNWLNPEKNPHTTILIDPVYRELKNHWSLP